MIKFHSNEDIYFHHTNALSSKTLEDSLKALWMEVTIKWLPITGQPYRLIKVCIKMMERMEDVADEMLVADERAEGFKGSKADPRKRQILTQKGNTNDGISSPTGTLKPNSKGRLRIQLPRLGRRPTIGLNQPGENLLGCDENMVPHQHPCLMTAPSNGPRTISNTFP